MSENCKRVLFGVTVLSALTIVASVSAIAARGSTTRKAGDALIRLGTVAHPATAEDRVDHGTASWLQATDAAGESPQIGTHLIGDARRLGELGSRAVYVVPTAMGRLCVVVSQLADSCSDPLTDARPITLAILDIDGPGGVGPIAYGAAEDGVKGVAFTVAGRSTHVLVHANMFAFRGRSSDTADDFSA